MMARNKNSSNDAKALRWLCGAMRIMQRQSHLSNARDLKVKPEHDADRKTFTIIDSGEGMPMGDLVTNLALRKKPWNHLSLDLLIPSDTNTLELVALHDVDDITGDLDTVALHVVHDMPGALDPSSLHVVNDITGAIDTDALHVVRDIRHY